MCSFVAPGRCWDEDKELRVGRAQHPLKINSASSENQLHPARGSFLHTEFHSNNILFILLFTIPPLLL